MVRRFVTKPSFAVFVVLVLSLPQQSAGQGATITATMSANEITSLTNKTNLAENVSVPLISRNGNRVAYIAVDPNVSGGVTVNVVNADGSGTPRQLASNNFASLLDISDDGSLVAYASPGGQLGLAATDGSNNRILAGIGGGYFISPRISADNSKVFFALDRDNSTQARGVWSINTNGTGVHQIISASTVATTLGVPLGQMPTTGAFGLLDRSTDGSKIVFVAGTPTGGAIFAANADGTNVHSILTNIQILDALSLSGDGSKIAYNMRPNPFPQPNQIVVRNFDGSGAVTLATNFNDDIEPMQLSSDGSQLLVGTAGRLYRTDGSGWLLLTAVAPFDEQPSDPPTILTNGTYGGTMNAAGTRIEYLASDANNVSQIIVMDFNSGFTGAAPVMSNPGVSPDFVLDNNTTSATETVHVTPATNPLYRVSSLSLVGNVADTGSGGSVSAFQLYDDGTHGDATAGDGTFTNNGVTASSNAVLGTRALMYRAEAKTSDGRRHASELQFTPFSVLKTAPYTFTVTASTPGLTVIVDGTPYSTPQQFLWDAGDSHTIYAPSPQTFGGATYTFNSWSDNGTESHTVTAPGGNMTYTAAFTSSGGTGGGCGSSPFVGTFNTNLGTLTVKQNADCTLTGTIPGGPTFTGAATGTTWTGTFTSPNGMGTFTFTASNGGFSGPYMYTSGTGTSGSLTTNPHSGGVTVTAGPVVSSAISYTMCGNSVPPGKTAFVSTDLITYWVALAGVNVGDVMAITYSGPGGATFEGQIAARVVNPWVCSTVGAAFIPAGNWSASVAVNGQLVPGSTLQFTLSGTGNGGGSNTGSGTASGPFNGNTCPGAVLTPPGQPVSAASTGGPYTIGVAAPSNCSWTAVPSVGWIHFPAGASGTGNQNLTFTVDANSGPPQAGSIAIAGQTEWVFQNGTPTGTSSGCVYVPQGGVIFEVPMAGTTSGGPVQFNTGPGCAWSAATLYPPGGPTGWITLIPPSSGANNGAVSFSVAANTTSSERSASIVVAGQNWVINQDGPGPGGSSVAPGTPIVPGGGVKNAASYAPSPPNAIAQGSFFSIFGTALGPNPYVQAQNPLPGSQGLSGVTVQILEGGNTYYAYLIFVSSIQINAIMPSNVPTGNAQVVVTYNGTSSAPIPIVVSAVSLGVFFQVVNGNNVAIAQNYVSPTSYPLNVPSTPAKPGQIVIIWGTGLGPINGPDNVAPGANAVNLLNPPANLPVSITVGGVAVPPSQVLYAGRQSQYQVDNIYFMVPNGVPYGCQIPVAITAGGVPANVANIAITADGSACQ